MDIHISQYSIISKHFSDKLGVHCEFVQDKATMFLRVDKEVHKMAKLDIGFINSEEMVQRVIFEFEKSLQA